MNNQAIKVSARRVRLPGRNRKQSRTMTLKLKKPSAPSNTSIRSAVSSRETVPVAMSRFRSTGSPKQEYLKNGDCVVTHSEFISDVAGSVDFSVNSFPVNPGQSPTFPWLSQMAGLYESYRLETLEFEYQNTCGTQTAGIVMLAIDYDASDSAPISKTQMAAYQGYARDAPWKDFPHRSSKENLNKRQTSYIRTGSLSANQDIKLYDIGNLFVASQGMADASNVGELYVKYKVRFMTPQLQNPAIGSSKSGRYTATTGAVVTVANSNAPLVISGNTTSGTILTASQAYSCLISVQVSSSAGSPVPDTSASTCTIESNTQQINATQGLYVAQLSFLPGQTFVFAQGASPQNQTIQVGQFNTAQL